MKTKSLDIFVFADALGWELAQKRAFMEDLFPVRSRCDTLLGYSCTCDPSILTGCLPEEHGHFSFFVDGRRERPFRSLAALGWIPEILAGHHRVRNFVSRKFACAHGYTGYFQLYSVPFSKLPWLDYTEKKDIYEPGGILGGQTTVFQHWKESGIPWVRSDWRQNDESNVRHLKSEIERGEVRLAYLFTSGLDAVMHAHTTRGPAVDAAFDRFEKWLREISDLARRHYETVRLHLFSDHGMTDTVQTSRMMLDFEELGLKYGPDYTAVWDSTMLRLWIKGGDSVRGTVMNWLKCRSEGTILSDDVLHANGCYFADGRYGELIYLLRNGVIFAPSYMNQRSVPGMHGFDPAEPDSAACWLTNHDSCAVPGRIEQIFQVMMRAMYNLKQPG